MNLPPFFRCFSVYLTGVLLVLCPACDVQRAPESPTAEEAAAVPSESPEVKTWSDIPVSDTSDRITIHYHREDGLYDDVNLWTWDAYDRHTPKLNAIAPIGRSSFGVVFQIDRANYGGSDRIGLIPRIGYDWSRKDGHDRFWTPALGNEIWLASNSNEVFRQLPGVLAAYLDAPDQITIHLAKPAPANPVVTVLSDEADPAVASAARSASTPLELKVTTSGPLNPVTYSYRIEVEGFGEAVPLVPRGILDDPALFHDSDAQLGAIYGPEATTFRIFAPVAKAASVVIYDDASGDRGRKVLALDPKPKGLWDTTAAGDLRGKFYTYRLEGPDADPDHEILDPYAVNAVASSTRARITAMPSAVTTSPALASPTDMVVYEMHVRDFTIAPNSGVKHRGLYSGWTEQGTRLPDDPQISTALDHLTELGITHVQLLPVQDFENNEPARQYNWGYITSAFFSPEGMFATNVNDDSRVRELKALVDALHARGIGVILDVVYNHTSPSAPFFAIAPHYYYRHLPDGSLADGAACGNEFRSEAPMARRYLIDSLKFWVTEYGVDGFRFDLMALIDQETMFQAERELREINPDIVLYGEPWAAAHTPLTSRTDKGALKSMEPLGAFNDDFRNALKGMPDGGEPGWIQNGSHRQALEEAMRVSEWFASPAQSINYMTCHDNLVLWDKLKASMPDATDEQLIRTMKLGYLALFTAQGVPFIHGGEEFARSKGGNHNSYEAPDSVNQVDWELKRKNHDLFTYTRDLIALRKAHPVFRLRTREEVGKRLRFEATTDERVLMFTLDGEGVPGETWKQIFVVLSSHDHIDTDLKLPPGRWFVAFDEDGAPPGFGREVSGKVTIGPKSGTILYQR